MADWLSSMQQTFEYYTVDPGTWKDVKLLDTVKSCTISRDSEADTLGSATFDITESLGESYIRVYLVTNQNGVKERHPLGTFLVQTPSSSYDGTIRTVTMDAYTPLLELKEKQPPIGYFIPKGNSIMASAYQLTRNNLRAPVASISYEKNLTDNFVANTNDTWISFISDLIKYAKFTFDIDEMGRILFAPQQDTEALQPVWTYTDDNSSILYPEITMKHDLYEVPNVVEVIYTNGAKTYTSVVKNTDENSPVSIQRRGREIPYRVTNPGFIGIPSEHEIDEYAERLLKELSTLEYELTYTHAYCPVRLGDCVRLNYASAGITDIKAKVISQSIKCEPGCPVSEKAVFTTKLWR